MAPASSTGRMLVGLVMLLTWLAVYMVFAAYVAVSILPRNIFAEVPFYAIAGVAWAFPARYLLVWMSRPPRPKEPPQT